MAILKKVAKAGGAGLVVASGGGTTVVAAEAMKKKIEGTTYNATKWGPLKEDASMVGIHYNPPAALDTADFVTVSGTPFDGRYPVARARTRNDVYIKPNQPVTESGSDGSFRVQTSISARLRHLGAAATAETRTVAKKTGNVVKKGFQLWIWWIKRVLLTIVVLAILYMIVTTVIKARVARAAGGPAI
jgi:hypothetical protein